MVSKMFPKRGSILQFNKGVPLSLFNKSVIWKRSTEIILNDAHYIMTSSQNISRFDVKLLHYKYLGVDYLIRRGEVIRARIPQDSYTECIGGNVLRLYPGFIKSRRTWQLEIDQMLRNAKTVC